MSLFLFMVLAAPVTYELDAEKTELLALTTPGGLPGATHPHVIRATRVTGKIVYDAEKPGESSVTLSFPTSGLDNDEPALRKREGMGSMGQGSRDAVKKNMFEADQLDPLQWAAIGFKSTAVKDIGHGQLEVTGKLSIRGVEKEITLPVSVKVKDGELVGSGGLAITHADFKFKPYQAALGLVKNLEQIALKLKLVGRAKPEQSSSAAQ